MTSRSKGRSQNRSRRSRPVPDTSAARSTARPTARSAATRTTSEARHLGRLYGHIYRVVRKIPRGRVATYGQVAELAGIPGAARVVGAAMRASLPAMGLPWQRVVGKRSKTLAQVRIHDPIGAATQRALLEDEGVVVTESGGISLRTHGWLPTGGAGSRRAKTGR